MFPHPEIVSELNRINTQTMLADAARRRLIASSRRPAPVPAIGGLGRAGGAGRAIAARPFRWTPRRLGSALARGFLVLGFVAAVLAAPTSAAAEASIARCRGEAVGPGADLAFCDLAGTDLTGADLRGADLSYADLTGVVTFGIRLVEIAPPFAPWPGGVRATGRGTLSNGASVIGRCLVGDQLLSPRPHVRTAPGSSGAALECWVAASVDLESATLVGTRLVDADLRDANLRYANLRSADLTGADLTGATWGGTTCPDGSNSEDHDGDGLSCLGNLTSERTPSAKQLTVG